MGQCAQCPFSSIAPTAQTWEQQQALIEVHWERNHAAPCLVEDERTGQLMTGMSEWVSFKLLSVSKLEVDSGFYRYQ